VEKANVFPQAIDLNLCVGIEKTNTVSENNQWRICFVWKNKMAFDVEIVDYH
jgi:plasmid maintenance system killer protein